MGRYLVAWMIKKVPNYLAIVLFVSFGSLSNIALVHAKEFRDPMQPPLAALRKFNQASGDESPRVTKKVLIKPVGEPMKLTQIIFSKNRKVAVIDDQVLVVGDRIRGATLVGLTRQAARLKFKGKVIDLSLSNDTTSVRKKATGGKL